MYVSYYTYVQRVYCLCDIDKPSFLCTQRRQYTTSVHIIRPDSSSYTPRDGNKVATNWSETEENQIHRKLQCNANVPGTKGQQEQAKIRIKHAELNLREGVSRNETE